MLARLLIPVFVAAFVAIACGDGEPKRTDTGTAEDASSAAASPTQDNVLEPTPQRPASADADLEPVVIGEPRWPLMIGKDLKTLMQSYEVVVGHVAEIVLPYDPTTGYLGVEGAPGNSLPSDHPKAGATPSPEELSRPPGRNFTVYRVEAINAVESSEIKIGQSIMVGQVGGVVDGKAYQLYANPPLRVGETYLLALDSDVLVSGLTGESGYFTGVPFAQFEVGDDSGLIPIDPLWSRLQAVKDLTGESADEAIELIEAEIDAQG